MKPEKFSFKEVTQQHALGLAKARVKEIVNDPDRENDCLYLVETPGEQCYYIEDSEPFIRPNLGERVIWEL